ncbi:hypothetical protein HDV05_001836 [Chytridiales sp. JEL 0842]|nr:hypothetical protein HDV05_001836 [Chytridiales sp. JEL 0842]
MLFHRLYVILGVTVALVCVGALAEEASGNMSSTSENGTNALVHVERRGGAAGAIVGAIITLVGGFFGAATAATAVGKTIGAVIALATYAWQMVQLVCDDNKCNRYSMDGASLAARFASELSADPVLTASHYSNTSGPSSVFVSTNSGFSGEPMFTDISFDNAFANMTFMTTFQSNHLGARNQVYSKFMVLRKDSCGLDYEAVRSSIVRDFRNQVSGESSKIGCVGLASDGCIEVAMKFILAGDEWTAKSYNDWGGCPEDAGSYKQYVYRIERDPCSKGCRCCRFAEEDNTEYGAPIFSPIMGSYVKMTKFAAANVTEVCTSCDQEGCHCIAASGAERR